VRLSGQRLQSVRNIPDGGRTIRHKLDVLARHCEEVARPFEAIEKTVSRRLNADETAAAFAERCASLAELGLDHAAVIAPGPWTEERVEVLAAAGNELRS
jgi:hypothetical protein